MDRNTILDLLKDEEDEAELPPVRNDILDLLQEKEDRFTRLKKMKESPEGEPPADFLWRRAIPLGSTFGRIGIAERERAAEERFEKGIANTWDEQVIAQKMNREELDKNASTRRKVLGALATVPAIAGEMSLAAPLAAPVRAGRFAGGMLPEAVAGAGRLGVVTAASPGYVEGAQQLAQETGGEATDLKNLGPAYLHQYLQFAVLGRLGKPAGKIPTAVGRGAVRTGIGLVESEAAEAVAKTTGLTTHYGPITELAKGDGDWKDVVAHVATFAAFSALHAPGDKQQQKAAREAVLENFRLETAKLAAQGFTPEQAGAKLKADFSKLAEATQRPPEPAQPVAQRPPEPAPAPPAAAPEVPAQTPRAGEIVAPERSPAVESAPEPPPVPRVGPMRPPVEATPQLAPEWLPQTRMAAWTPEERATVAKELGVGPKLGLNRLGEQMTRWLATVEPEERVRFLRSQTGKKAAREVPESVAQQIADSPLLTPQEKQTLALAMEGYSSRDMGRVIGLSHERAIQIANEGFRKLQVADPEGWGSGSARTVEEFNKLGEEAQRTQLEQFGRSKFSKQEGLEDVEFRPGAQTAEVEQEVLDRVLQRWTQEGKTKGKAPEQLRVEAERSPEFLKELVVVEEQERIQLEKTRAELDTDARAAGRTPAQVQGDIAAVLAEAEKVAASQRGPEQTPQAPRPQRSLREAVRKPVAAPEPMAEKPVEAPTPPQQPDVAFSGAPIQITALDRLLNKGTTVTNAVRKWLTSAGDLPPEVFAEKVKADGRIAAFAQEVRNTEKDLQRALMETTGKRWDQIPEDRIKPLNDALKGDTEALNRLPPPVRQHIEAMRSKIDGLSQALIQSGAIAEPLVATVEGNLGAYLNRGYRVFTDPKWAEKVDPAVRNRFKSWLMAEGQAETLAEAEGITKSLLYNGTAEESPIAFLAKSKLGSKDLSILKQRKDVPAELRALWGEFHDPLVNYSNTVGRMSNLLAQHQFLNTVRQQGLGKFFFEQPTETHFARIAPKGSEAMNPLNGLYTTPEIQKAFESVYAKRETSALMKGYMTLMGLTKYAKTILSPQTHIRNLLGNTGFAVANGHYRIGKALPAIKVLAKDTPESRAAYGRLLELGIVGDGVHAGEFRDVVNGVLGERDITAGESMNRVSDKRIASWVRKGSSLAEKLYHAEDAVWKTYAFENEKARYREAYPSWTEAQVEQRAADIVRNTYPTYSLVPAAVKGIRRFPLVGPFVSFPSEVVRTTYHTAKLALEELRTPETRSIGATRLAGLTLAMTIPAALAAGTRAMFGIDRDEERAMRRFMPDWSKDSHVIHLGKNQKGEHRYIDLGYSDPHAYLWSPVLAATRGDDYKQSLKNAAERVAEPFLFDEELLAGKLADLARNRQQSGAPVYNPQASPLDRAKTMAGHVGEAFEPGAVTSGRRIVKAVQGTPDEKTGRKYDPEDEIAANVTGQRLQYIKPEESLGFKARAFLRQKQEAVALLTEVAGRRGMVADADLQEAHAKMEQARRKLYDEMRLDIQAAQTLGLKPQEVLKSLKSAGMSDEDAVLLMRGIYQPHRMDPNTLLKRASPDVPLTPKEAIRRAGVVGKAK